ncbi:hypothetical protein CSC78_05835 [Pseudoxanthomonas japonensis]|uniref:Uncharacterized protein n=2 Tax=Pseudoxanthomonas japonensis TaxID=69284 RepID=A0ABQ6ZJ91_9GAMM|nr:hypothetical protein CSC78_05835 [Pseudoxanthomonas japonensis]
MMPKIFIFGSCVSRDALEQVPDSFELAGYLARTSMASVGMPPVDDADARAKVAALPSPFQRRMAINDFDKSTLSVISSTPHDLLLIDFIDERFNLISTGASFFSHSGELQHAGLDPGERAVIAPGSDEFLALWLAGFERFVAAVDIATVVLNRAYWAEQFPDGSDASSLRWIRSSNAILQQLYDAVEARWSLRTIYYPKASVLADPEHRWGKAPYHYSQSFYEHAIRSLKVLAWSEGRG